MASVDETMRLFGSARMIVGVHGAGLVNMLFMPPGSHVVELLLPEPCFRGDFEQSAIETATPPPRCHRRHRRIPNPTSPNTSDYMHLAAALDLGFSYIQLPRRVYGNSVFLNVTQVILGVSRALEGD